MTFRYAPFWLHLLLYAAGVGALVSISLIVASGLEIVVPSLPKVPSLHLIVVLVLTFCAALPLIALALQMHERIYRFYPARPLVLTEQGISFDLPLGVGGFVDWRDVASVDRIPGARGVWYVAIEFRRKLPLGPTGLEKELSRLLIGGHRILPYGREFLEAAQRYHAQATGRPEAAEQRGEPRQSILRKLAWTFRRTAR